MSATWKHRFLRMRALC